MGQEIEHEEEGGREMGVKKKKRNEIPTFPKLVRYFVESPRAKQDRDHPGGGRGGAAFRT